jgi:hypothetical protein
MLEKKNSNRQMQSYLKIIIFQKKKKKILYFLSKLSLSSDSHISFEKKNIDRFNFNIFIDNRPTRRLTSTLGKNSNIINIISLSLSKNEIYFLYSSSYFQFISCFVLFRL